MKYLLLIVSSLLATLHQSIAQLKIDSYSKVPNPNLVLVDTKLQETSKCTQVMVPTFSINFITQSSLSLAKIKTPTIPATANITLVNLTGIKDFIFQQITDDAYHYYVTKLMEAGFTYLDRDKFEQNYNYRKLVTKESDNSEKKIKGSLFELNSVKNGGMAYRTFSAGNNPTIQFVNVPGNILQLNKVVKEMKSNFGDFNLTIDFMEYFPVKTKTEKWDVSNSTGAISQVVMDCKPNLFAQYFSANFYTPNLITTSGTNKLFTSLDSEFKKQINSSVKTPDLIKQFGKNVRIFELVADQNAYKEACLEIAKKHIDLLISKIKNKATK